MVVVFFASAYVVFLLTAQFGVRGPLERLLPTFLVAFLITAVCAAKRDKSV